MGDSGGSAEPPTPATSTAAAKAEKQQQVAHAPEATPSPSVSSTTTTAGAATAALVASTSSLSLSASIPRTGDRSPTSDAVSSYQPSNVPSAYASRGSVSLQHAYDENRSITTSTSTLNHYAVFDRHGELSVDEMGFVHVQKANADGISMSSVDAGRDSQQDDDDDIVYVPVRRPTRSTIQGVIPEDEDQLHADQISVSSDMQSAYMDPTTASATAVGVSQQPDDMVSNKQTGNGVASKTKITLKSQQSAQATAIPATATATATATIAVPSQQTPPPSSPNGPRPMTARPKLQLKKAVPTSESLQNGTPVNAAYPTMTASPTTTTAAPTAAFTMPSSSNPPSTLPPMQSSQTTLSRPQITTPATASRLSDPNAPITVAVRAITVPSGQALGPAASNPSPTSMNSNSSLPIIGKVNNYNRKPVTLGPVAVKPAAQSELESARASVTGNSALASVIPVAPAPSSSLTPEPPSISRRGSAVITLKPTELHQSSSSQQLQLSAVEPIKRRRSSVRDPFEIAAPFPTDLPSPSRQSHRDSNPSMHVPRNLSSTAVQPLPQPASGFSNNHNERRSAHALMAAAVQQDVTSQRSIGCVTLVSSPELARKPQVLEINAAGSSLQLFDANEESIEFPVSHICDSRQVPSAFHMMYTSHVAPLLPSALDGNKLVIVHAGSTLDVADQGVMEFTTVALVQVLLQELLSTVSSTGLLGDMYLLRSSSIALAADGFVFDLHRPDVESVALSALKGNPRLSASEFVISSTATVQSWVGEVQSVIQMVQQRSQLVEAAFTITIDVAKTQHDGTKQFKSAEIVVVDAPLLLHHTGICSNSFTSLLRMVSLQPSPEIAQRATSIVLSASLLDVLFPAVLACDHITVVSLCIDDHEARIPFLTDWYEEAQRRKE
jgi:hypothetical protein